MINVPHVSFMKNTYSWNNPNNKHTTPFGRDGAQVFIIYSF